MKKNLRAAAMLVGVITIGLGLGVAAGDIVQDAAEARAREAAGPLVADAVRPDPAPTLAAMGAPGSSAPAATAPKAAPSAAAEPSALAAGSAAAGPTLPLPSVDDPAGLLADLVTFARSGKGRLAIGAGIVLLVWLLRRHVFKRVPWFTTQLGGYVASFGTTALLYVGGALGADMAISLDIIADALATGFAASGQHEAARDVVVAARARGAHLATMLVIASVSLLAGVVIVSSAAGCGVVQKSGAAPAVIECTSHAEEVDAFTAELAALLAGGSSWRDVYARAKEAGKVIGGCAVAKLVTDYLARPTLGAPADDRDEARATLERFRAEVAGGATFRTAAGDL